MGIMCLRVLAGDFPLFFYGQDFMGSLEAYLNTPLLFFLGPTPLALETLPVLLSLLFIALSYRMVERVFGAKVAWISGLWLAVPPLFYLHWSHEARSHYPLTLIFGTLLFLLTLHLAEREAARKKTTLLFAGLGLISGMAWWTNYLIIAYLLPMGLAVFLLNTRVLWSRRAIAFSFFFLLGSLPLRLHHWGRPSTVRVFLSQIGFTRTGEYFQDLIGNALPILLGFLPPRFKESPFDFFCWLTVAAIFLTAGGVFIYRLRSDLKNVLFLRLAPSSLGVLFLLLFLANLAANVFTVYGLRLSDNDQKYLLPLYTTLPVFLGVLIAAGIQKSRFVGLALLGFILLVNIVESFRHEGWLFLNPSKYKVYQQEEKRKILLADFLKKNELTRVYDTSGLGKEITFRSGGAIIFADPIQENVLRQAEMVDGAWKLAWLGDDPAFEAQLRSMGGSYQRISAPGGYSLYTAFKPPPGGDLVDRSLWRGSSYPPSRKVGQAFDGNVGTSWRGPQQPGTFIRIDFGAMETIQKVLFLPDSHQDTPAGYRLEVSTNGSDWQTVAQVDNYLGPLFWSGTHPMDKIRYPRVEASFRPAPARFLRIEQTGRLDLRDWSINELFVYRPAAEDQPQATPGDLQALAAFMAGQRIKTVYADHWLSATLREKTGGRIKTITSNYFLDDYGGRTPPPAAFPKVDFSPAMALIVDKPHRTFLEAALTAAGCGYQRLVIGPWQVYYGITPPLTEPRSKLPRNKAWRILANANPQAGALAIDGNPNTCWSSQKPQEPGLTVQIDLGKTWPLQGITLHQGSSRHDFPRKLIIRGSSDGSTWEDVKAKEVFDYYWSGLHLLRLPPEIRTYLFPARAFRYLTLIQMGDDPVYNWSIHELEILG